MKVKEFIEKFSLKKLSGDGEKEIKSCYICNLLSRVMNGCEQGDIWITVQTSMNVIAVATLSDAACVLFPEGIVAPQEVIEKAEEEGITLVSSEKSAFELANLIAPLV